MIKRQHDIAFSMAMAGMAPGALLLALVTLGLPGAAQAQTEKPYLVFSDNPRDAAEARKDLLVRPNVEQPFYLYVVNPGAAKKSVSVRLSAGDPPVEIGKTEAIAIDAGATQRVSFPKPMPMPPPGQPAPWIELTGTPLRFQAAVLDANGKELEKRNVNVTLLLPSQYVDVTQVEYNGREGRLRARVHALREFSGPPSRVKLIMDPQRIPGLVAGGREYGTLSGALTRERDVGLLAERLQVKEGASKNGLVSITVDGYERAFVFETTFDRLGGIVQPQRVRSTKPIVRLVAPRYFQPGPDYPVQVEVDNPPRADVGVEIGVDRDKSGTYETQTFIGDRQEKISLQSATPDGALRIKSFVQDWHKQFDLSDIVGARQLRVRLLDKQNRPIEILDSTGAATDAVYATVNLDNTPPDEGSFLEPPKRSRRGEVLIVRAKGVDMDSGIHEVNFFADKPTPEGKIPPGVQIVKGVEGSDGVWSAKVPLPTDRPSVSVSAQFVNGVNLSKFDTIAVELVEAAAGAPAPGGGTIKGKVLEGGRPQPALEVTLKDATGAAKGTAKTDGKGDYTLKDVAPGNYNVSCAKAASQTKGEKSVKVEAGKTHEVDIELFR